MIRVSRTTGFGFVLTLFPAVFTGRVISVGSAVPWQAPVEVEAEESTCSGKAAVSVAKCNGIYVHLDIDRLDMCLQMAFINAQFNCKTSG